MTTGGAVLDTIVAPATPHGRSALAMIRLDGPLAKDILFSLSEICPEPRQATLLKLRIDGELIDEAIIISYPAPRSFTGNDLVELVVHGSPYIVDRLLRACSERGARYAEPGEFTERAVLNGKVDLVQAEAINDLISSRTGLQARLSMANLSGALSAEAFAVRARLLDVIARTEAALDFAEDDYHFISRDETLEILGNCEEALRALLETYERGRATRMGLSAVILGQPNAGKSTLLNFLCGSERAIVTDIPGTTRDLLHETVEVGGLPVTLTDTAGLRASGDLIEEIGVRRAREIAGRADLVLYLIDCARGMDDADRQELAALPDPVVIFTKADRQPAPRGALAISVKEHSGLEALLSLMDAIVRERFATPEAAPAVVNERQRSAIVDTLQATRDALATVTLNASDEIVLVDLYRAANALGVLTGAISNEEVLSEIFQKFCIGK